MAAPHFHAHFTLDDTLSARFPLGPHGPLTLPRGFKATFIHLEGVAEHQQQTDIMLTTHYAGDLAMAQAAVARAQADARMLATLLGGDVVRVKVEFLGDFELELTPERYLEAHIKTCSTEKQYPATLARLRELAPEYGFRLSSNPRERKEGVVRHFANMRIRAGSAAAGRQQVACLQQLLRSEGIQLERSHIELNIWDSNRPRDSWWA